MAPVFFLLIINLYINTMTYVENIVVHCFDIDERNEARTTNDKLKVEFDR